jgi:tetrapyrrole methylase family protein/MazG family protein
MKNATGKQFERLVQIMHVLRGPNGCPWDQQQTHFSLRRFLLEEAYEVLDAIDANNPASLREELGDYIFEAVFIAQLSEEAGDFSIGDVLNTVCEKLIRRHPYVFNQKSIQNVPITSEHALQIWNSIKAEEKLAFGERSPIGKPETLSNVPPSLPALLRAYKINSRAASVGFDWKKSDDAINKIEEEVSELRCEVESGLGDNKLKAEMELGDLLFTIVNLARKLQIEPESALRKATEKFINRFEEMEKNINNKGRSLREVSLKTMDEEWELIKNREQEA